MNKKKWGIVLLFFWLLSLVFLLFMVMGREEHRRFEESDRSLDNPDRGFYIQIKSSRPDKIADAAKEVRVILLSFDIEEYGQEELPEQKMEELRIALDTAKREQVAVIFRAAYGFHRDVVEPDRIERMAGHIAKISEVLNAYPEQILVVQAGMFGAYGEWHASRYLEGTEEEKRENRLYLLRQWDTYLDPGIKVAVRRPRFVREAMAEQILTGRLGIHNDALLSNSSDMGTYDDPGRGRAEELQWVHTYLKGQVNGGEMPMPGKLNDPQNADHEFGKLYISYLNMRYNEEIISRWAGMTMEGTDVDVRHYLGSRLGYRLFVSELDVRSVCFAGELSGRGIRIQIRLCNTGYAPLPDKYRVFLTVGGKTEQLCDEVEMPELYEIAGGQSVRKEVYVRIPDEFLAGKEEINFGLKIAPDRTMTDGRDCVELANDGFVYDDGNNKLLYMQRKGKFFFKTVRQENASEIVAGDVFFNSPIGKESLSSY